MHSGAKVTRAWCDLNKKTQVRNVRLMGYETPTPIQQHAVPLAFDGNDLMW